MVSHILKKVTNQDYFIHVMYEKSDFFVPKEATREGVHSRLDQGADQIEKKIKTELRTGCCHVSILFLWRAKRILFHALFLHDSVYLYYEIPIVLYPDVHQTFGRYSSNSLIGVGYCGNATGLNVADTDVQHQ